MRPKRIRFFTQQDNATDQSAKASKQPDLVGSISAKGIVVFPRKVADYLNLSTGAQSFQIGTSEGKKKVTSLFLVAAGNNQDDAFPLEKAGRSLGINLAGILHKSGLDYQKTKYTFTIKPFNQGNLTGYELQLDEKVNASETAPKRRGRRPKVRTEEA